MARADHTPVTAAGQAQAAALLPLPLPPHKSQHLPVLDEANVGRVLAEAATAHVNAIFADQATLAVADTAAAAALGVVLRVGVVRVRHFFSKVY